MGSKLLKVSGGLAAALSLMSGTAAAQGDYGDFGLDLGTREPGAGATLRFDVLYRNPNDPDGKPPTIKASVFRLPEGARIDTNAVPRCAASDEELRARGKGACPDDTRVGSGTLTAFTGFGPPADPVQGDVTAFNGEDEVVEVVTAPGTDRVLGIDRLSVAGSTLTAHPPTTPGGPPDGRTAVKEVHLTVDRAGYATAPPGCPAGGWTYGSSYEFTDGTRDENTGTLPCVRARPALAFRALPARLRAGRRVRATFRVTSPDPSCRSGAKVRFAGRRGLTDARGRVSMTVAPPAGSRPVNASKRGCRTARGVVRVSP